MQVVDEDGQHVEEKKLHSMCRSTEWSMSASGSVEKNQSMRVVKERCVGGVAVKSTRSMESARMNVRMEIRPRDDTHGRDVASSVTQETHTLAQPFNYT